MAGSERSHTPSISIVVPALNEATMLPDTLASCVVDNAPQEIVIVDGGSGDRTRELAAEFLAMHTAVPGRLGECTAGRARQMNTGAQMSRSGVLLFLHADTQLPGGALDAVRTAIRRGAVWGRFDVCLSGTNVAFRLIESLMNWRSRVTGIATGDQALFVRRDAFRMVGGFRPLPLMEDVDLSARLRIFGRPATLGTRVRTSSRRWERHGIARTILRMWALRLLYFAGVSPDRLARWYR